MESHQPVLLTALRSAHRPGALRSDTDTNGSLAEATATLLRALLSAPDHAVSFDDLADLSWSGQRPKHWRRLISLQGRWLGERLPTGWAIIDDRVELRLSVQDGMGDQSFLLRSLREELHHLSSSRTAPSKLASTEKAASADVTAICERRRHQQSRLPLLIRNAPVAVVTHGPDQPAPSPRAWTEMLIANDQKPGFVFVGGVAPDVAFGDVAAAFAPARWELLDLQGRNEQARVSHAWRILRDHIAAAGAATDVERHAVIIDAHKLDNSSLELARLILRFPLAPNMNIALVGDGTDPRPGWQQLLAELDSDDCPRFDICPVCEPDMLCGQSTDGRRRLAM